MRYGIYLILMCIASLHARSVHRPISAHPPHIQAYWQETPETCYTLYHEHLQYWPLFTRFDYQHMLDNYLPSEEIPYRNEPENSVSGNTFDTQLQECITRIVKGKNRNSHCGDFKIIKDRDFNYKYNAGVIILKSKSHPFIVKLFMETPYTLTKPYSKGIEPCFFFSMTGGSSRFFAGFTRIKNKQYIEERLKQSDIWRDQVTVPRKWFWVPHNIPWISIDAYHLSGPGNHDHTSVPSVYAIVSDAIETKTPYAMFDREHRKIALNLTHYIGEHRLDPHIDNFVIESKTDKIAIIDTEHFASMTGLDDDFTSKAERNKIHTYHIPETLKV